MSICSVIFSHLAQQQNEHRFIKRQQRYLAKYNTTEYPGQQLNFHYQLLSPAILCVCVCVCVNCTWSVWSLLSLWVSGLEESQVSRCCSSVPGLFDEETSCKIDVNLKVTRSSLRACSAQPVPAAAPRQIGLFS